MEPYEEHPANVSRRPFEPRVVLVLGLGVFLAMILRFSLFDFESGDYRVYYGAWYDFIVEHGGFSAFRYSFADYSPLYLYFLTLATYLPLPKLYAIKLISISFDFLLAFFVLLLVRRKYDNRIVWISSFFVTLFAPTIFINSALVGQADATYTSMLVASIYFAIQRRPNLAIFFFAVALSFKLQAVFLFPLFIVLLLKRRIPIYSFLIVPVTYMVSVLPAWFAGRPMSELLMTYAGQAGQYSEAWTMYAPNLYQWLPKLYQWLPKYTGLFQDPSSLVGLLVSLLFAGSLVCLLCLVSWRSSVPLDKEVIVKLALVSVLLLPFVLPRMHDNYFFAADVVSIIYAFYTPKRFFVPIIVGAASLFSYFPFLFETEEEPISLRYLAILMALALIIVAADLSRSLKILDGK